jgi:RsiW-degrading membrane proteinase PrsW (M82 family)
MSALYLLIGLAGPLVMAVSVGRIAKLPADPQVWHRFSAGTATAFVALICEQYAFQHLRWWLPYDFLIPVEAFLFIATPEEIAKLSLIYGAMLSARIVEFRTCAIIGLVVSAGFAGAENVLYLIGDHSDLSTILWRRMLTAVPFHLSNAAVATFLLCKARALGDAPRYLLLAVAVSISLHGLYDYLVLSDQVGSGKYLFALLMTLSMGVMLLRRASVEVATDAKVR